MNTYPLDNVPVFVIFITIVVLILTSCLLGYRVGVHIRTRYEQSAVASQGPFIAGLLGMLGFVLAFSFSIAASLNQQRKINVVTEATAIGTAYLRADLLKPQQREEIKRLLREYVDIRLRGAKDDAFLPIALQRSVEIHNLIWKQAASAAKTPNINTSLMVQSINNVIDIHQKRVTDGLRARIPASIWVALLAISLISMAALGLQIGLMGSPMLMAIMPLSLAFAVLATLVVDLDRPQSGLIVVGQHAMEDLRDNLRLDEK